jgi:hypothetical protein
VHGEGGGGWGSLCGAPVAEATEANVARLEDEDVARIDVVVHSQLALVEVPDCLQHLARGDQGDLASQGGRFRAWDPGDMSTQDAHWVFPGCKVHT